MEIVYIPRHGPHMALPPGWLALPGKGLFKHRFGGESWQVIDPHPLFGGPTLLLTLDLADPALKSLHCRGLSELPLPSYIDCDLWLYRQDFLLRPQSREIIVTRRSDPNDAPEPDCMFPNPLPEKTLQLKKMKQSEYPIDENSYWRICDDFLGGPGFIRVLGPPIWLQYLENIDCTCGAAMDYVASIGYEFGDNLSGFIEKEPFFIGEAALYFFFCKQCGLISVISQSAST